MILIESNYNILILKRKKNKRKKNRFYQEKKKKKTIKERKCLIEFNPDFMLSFPSHGRLILFANSTGRCLRRPPPAGGKLSCYLNFVLLSITSTLSTDGKAAE